MKLQTKTTLMALGLACVGGLLSTGDVHAATVDPADIEPRSYVIGSHLFTREANPYTGYEGYINTRMIMKAAKTINSNDLADMNIYYKKADGTWVDGLTNEAFDTMPNSFNLRYENFDLYAATPSYSAAMDTSADAHGNDDDYTYTKFIFTLNNASDYVEGDPAQYLVDGFQFLIPADQAGAMYIARDLDDCDTEIDGVDYCEVIVDADDANSVTIELPADGADYDIYVRAYADDGDHIIYGDYQAFEGFTSDRYWVVATSERPGQGVIHEFVKDGEKTSEPVPEGRYGYNFDAWYVGRACTPEEKTELGLDDVLEYVCPDTDQEFDFDTAISSDITLSAKYDHKVYVVTVEPVDPNNYAVDGHMTVTADGSTLDDSFVAKINGVVVFNSSYLYTSLTEFNGVDTLQLVITYEDADHVSHEFTTDASIVKNY